MNDPIVEVLQYVANTIECTYAHDEYGRVNGAGNLSDADVVESLRRMEGEVLDALRSLDIQTVLLDLPKAVLQSIVAVLLSKFDRDGDGVSWDHQDVAECAYRMLHGHGLLP